MDALQRLIVTVSGLDRPGIAAELSGSIHGAGANLADSRMVSLGGRYAMLALVEGTADALALVQARLRETQPSLKARFEFSAPVPAGPPGVPFRLKTYSMDQPGIVHRFTERLSELGINVSQVETKLESAPFMGTPVFTMEVLMVVPADASVKDLRRSLEKLGDELNCDVDLDRA